MPYTYNIKVTYKDVAHKRQTIGGIDGSCTCDLPVRAAANQVQIIAVQNPDHLELEIVLEDAPRP